MATRVDPFSFPEIWDVINVANIKSPGICVVSGVENAGVWDVKKPGSGGTVTFKGRDINEAIVVTFKLWTPEQMDDWAEFEAKLNYDPDKGLGKAFDVWHPALDAAKVRSVVTKSIGQPTYEGGMVTIVVTFLEYRPPPKTTKVKTPDGSNRNGVSPPSAQSASSSEIDKLAQQAQNLTPLLAPPLGEAK